MKRGKKTIDVERVKVLINTILEQPSTKVTDIEKRQLCTVLETILHETGNYHGYNNLDWIRFGGFEKWKEENGNIAETAKYTGREYTRIYY